MTLITRIADKAGTFGSVVSAFACAVCFPAIASIGAALGLDFLQEYEGLFINRRRGPDGYEMPAAPASLKLICTLPSSAAVVQPWLRPLKRWSAARA